MHAKTQTETTNPEWKTKHELLMSVYHTHHSVASNNLLQKRLEETHKEKLILKLYIVND